MRGMETVAPSHDPWCLAQNTSLRHGRRRLCDSSACRYNLLRWSSCKSLQSHNNAYGRYGIASAKIRPLNAPYSVSVKYEGSHESQASFFSSKEKVYFAEVCRGSGLGNGSSETSPEEEDADKFVDTTPTVRNEEETVPGEGQGTNEEDWRSFRARLVVGEQLGSTVRDGEDHGKEILPKALSKKWAHSLPFPEAGCLLVATKKLDGHPPFERAVILLLRLGSSKPQDGPFGIILNRPILHTMRGMEPITERMAQMLQNCRLFYGGPLPADIFLLMQTAEGYGHLEEIMPGVYYGYAHSLQQTSDLASQDKILQDFRFYVGYAGWDFNQLKDEIAEGFWWVSACSPDLIKEVPSESLWQEVLLSMGGEHAEIGRKAAQGGDGGGGGGGGL